MTFFLGGGILNVHSERFPDFQLPSLREFCADIMPPMAPEERASLRRVWALLSALLVCAASVTGCPHKCSCSGSHVDCQGLGLKSVPKGVPRNAERL